MDKNEERVAPGSVHIYSQDERLTPVLPMSHKPQPWPSNGEMSGQPPLCHNDQTPACIITLPILPKQVDKPRKSIKHEGGD